MNLTLDPAKVYDRLGNILNTGDYVLYANCSRDCALRVGSVLSTTRTTKDAGGPPYELILKMHGSKRFLYGGRLNHVVKVDPKLVNDIK